MIIQTITWKSLPLQPVNRFSAGFAAGVYDFSLNPGNANQVVIPLNKQYIYLIDSISFSASIPEADYLEAITTVPEFSFKFLRTPYNIYPFPIQGVQYLRGENFNFWFSTDKENDALLISMTGVLTQTPALVGVANIFAQFSEVMYQESNGDKIKAMKEKTCGNIGAFYQNGLG